MDYVDELQQQAAAAIEAMRAAALEARRRHARAELMRHMRTTAAKMAGLPIEEAVRRVAGEWMQAWHLGADAYPEIAAEMTAFTRAFCAHAANPGPDTDAAVRAGAALLDDAFARAGTSIADQMAWRSECAHGWWEMVAPTPPDLVGRKERPTVPRPVEGQPFWDAGCAPHCMG